MSPAELYVYEPSINSEKGTKFPEAEYFYPDIISENRSFTEAPHGSEIIKELTKELSEVLSPSENIVTPTGLHLINTRAWLNDLSSKAGEPITVGSVPKHEWTRLFNQFDSFWFMGIYQASEASHQHSIKWSHEYKPNMPDLDVDSDVDASPFAIPEYSPNPKVASSWEEWDEMVDMLHDNGKKTMLDFVPNHVGLDHAWAKSHPEYFIQGRSDQVSANPGGYKKYQSEDGYEYFLAHGKDPNFSEWQDTLQLNYANPDLQAEMENIVLDLVDHSDGLRCDMAMLLNPGTFLRTWGDHLSKTERDYISSNEFWPKVTAKAKDKAREMGKDNFYFIAEAYWDKEELGRKGFDYIYGKEFYDHLNRLAHNKEGEKPENLRWHLIHLMTANQEGRPYKDVLFTENHDENRAPKVFGADAAKAATVISGCVPDSILLFNQGQEDGRTIKPPMQVNRFPTEEVHPETQRFYEDFLRLKRSKLFQSGSWRLAYLKDDNPSIIAQQVEMSEDPDRVMESGDESVLAGAVVCTNFSRHTASCRIPDIAQDKLPYVYNLTDGKPIQNPDILDIEGMFVALEPWETQVVFYVPLDNALSNLESTSSQIVLH